MSGENPLRAIPSVDEILAVEGLAALRECHPLFPWTKFVREVVDEHRLAVQRQGRADTRDAMRKRIVIDVIGRFEELRHGGMRRVINGTGVLLHTNLGRAVVGEAVGKAVSDALGHYVNLEVDIDRGRRSHRGLTLAELIRLASGAEAAMVVNNNAAAVYLVVNTFSPPGRVIISRGELVEIGGSFRLPDILERAAAEVIEVGTTNRTYIDDYANIAREGDVLLKAHQSNYEIQGFTHSASIEELVELARDRRCHVVHDLGSGSFFDFSGIGIEGEETVPAVIEQGVDCVTMSGDKLLGGVQAGLIVGSRIFLDQLAKNPLRRALRIDKVTVAALQVLMRTYLFANDPVPEVPALRQITGDPEELRKRAGRILDELPTRVRQLYRATIVDDPSAVGGGSFAAREVDAVALAFRCESEKAATKLAGRLRGHTIPILSRIKGDEVRVNLRSVLESEDSDLTAGLALVLGS